LTAPSSTYRFQLHPGFTFADAAQRVPYLAELGVSHVYLSPVLQSAPGSTHGYDVVDPGRLDEELGGDAGFAELVEATHAHGLGIVVDIVPNHVGLLSPHNPWWWDVLRHGPDSRYADHLDIRWHRRGDGPPQVLLPQLGRPLDEELADGDDLRLAHASDGLGNGGHAAHGEGGGEDGFRIVYHEHVWPVRPGSLEAVGLEAADVPGTLAAIHDDRGRLFSLLMQQHYRLVHWRRANHELNYRRFFDITTLGGVRIEDRAVFADAHRRILELVADGAIDGLRIDHPDGLRDPAGYFGTLREAAPATWIVAEKILEAGESRRADWPIDGTVGYEFSNRTLGLFVDGASERVLDDLYTHVIGHRVDYEQVVDDAKREVLDRLFPAEVSWLATAFAELAAGAGVVADQGELDAALREVLVCFPVYRTYVRADDGEVCDTDRRYVTEAVARARARRPDLDEPLDLLIELLLLEQGGAGSADFVMRFQQLTGPVMAKGVEDTVFYRYLRFAAVNEVGGHPAQLGTATGAYHEANHLRQRDWPATMLSTSTHDTKRSEDVRARLVTLSELPDVWVRTVEEWHELAAPHRGVRGPSPAHEYLTFQTLVGAWPIDADRAAAYLQKAAREGKEHTDWLDEDPSYEADLEAFVRGLLDDDAFVASLEQLLDQVLEPGRLTALSQSLLKLTSPGIPDIYQGCELWDLSLVDPDNRRPVDLERRHQLLRELEPDTHPVDVLAGIEEGVPKLWVTHRALQLRRERPHVFGQDASYAPLYAAGERADHLVAFVRGGEVITVAPRLIVGLGGGFVDWEWGDTDLCLPPGRWRCVLSGQVADGGATDGGGPGSGVPLRELLAAFPVGLLVREDPEEGRP
jgi:(1->4)-alpha-D-glucan 1-alpha-D-glucosylmutase